MSVKFGDARMPSLRDKIQEQARLEQERLEQERVEAEKKVEVKEIKKGRRLNK